jgi:long-chain acyl-CoA synthetase
MTSHYNRLHWGLEAGVCPDITRLEEYLPLVRPTLLFGPPRIWEKLAAALDRHPPAEARQAVGLDALELAIGGAAPVPQPTMDRFRAVGIRFNEMYGLSESSGVITWDAENRKPKSVGRLVEGLELRLADDGEIQCRGPLVFAGYLGDPERTRDAIDDDGWLHTGDLGRLDDEGDLFIVGRKADIVITSGGKNVAAPPIEAAVGEHPLVDRVVLVGDGRPYVTAIVVATASPSQVPVLVDHVRAVNSRFSRAERVKAIALIHDDWTGDGELVTPTLKLRRMNILQRYAALADALYDGGDDRVVPIPQG